MLSQSLMVSMICSTVLWSTNKSSINCSAFTKVMNTECVSKIGSKLKNLLFPLLKIWSSSSIMKRAMTPLFRCVTMDKHVHKSLKLISICLMRLHKMSVISWIFSTQTILSRQILVLIIVMRVIETHTWDLLPTHRLWWIFNLLFKVLILLSTAPVMLNQFKNNTNQLLNNPLQQFKVIIKKELQIYGLISNRPSIGKSILMMMTSTVTNQMSQSNVSAILQMNWIQNLIICVKDLRFQKLLTKHLG